jgi:hypothetical protein
MMCSMDRIDRASLFTSILERNALRREAKLPLLPVRETFETEVRIAEWHAFCEQHAQAVWDEILGEKRRTYADWGNSAGGQLYLRVMTTKALRERFAQQRRDR